RVGDRYVVEAMRKAGMNVGGEPSGHVILSDYSTTGDGLVTALQVLSVIGGEQRPASEVCAAFEPVPQILENVRLQNGDPLEDQSVKAAIEAGEARLGSTGRLVIRKSGTEPLIRVMGEADDLSLLQEVVGSICKEIERAA
ncbi:MAG: phosphoglucosamine mutase, partial [Pseudomonadota bacterium]